MKLKDTKYGTDHALWSFLVRRSIVTSSAVEGINMKIIDIECNECKEKSELFLKNKEEPKCPACDSLDVSILISAPKPIIPRKHQAAPRDNQ